MKGAHPQESGGTAPSGRALVSVVVVWPDRGHCDENEPVPTTTFEALTESIRARRHPGDDRCLVVGVDGLSGAGKTSFAARLSAELSAPCVSSDGLVPGWDGLEASLEGLVDWILDPLARESRHVGAGSTGSRTGRRNGSTYRL